MAKQPVVDVAAKVRGAAAERRRTQSDLARALGVSRMAITRRFSGDVPFSADELQTLSAYLDIPVGAFFGEPVGERAS